MIGDISPVPLVNSPEIATVGTADFFLCGQKQTLLNNGTRSHGVFSPFRPEGTIHTTRTYALTREMGWESMWSFMCKMIYFSINKEFIYNKNSTLTHH